MTGREAQSDMPELERKKSLPSEAKSKDVFGKGKIQAVQRAQPGLFLLSPNPWKVLHPSTPQNHV